MKKSSLLGVAVAPLLLLPSAPVASAAGVCDGVSGCRVVSSADVDGDGRSDRVGVVNRGLASGGSFTVRVRTAKGRTMSVTTRNVWWYRKSAWHGAAKTDGRSGYELVLGTSAGAHYLEFQVLTYRNGRLSTLRAPGGRYRWGVDSSYSYNMGWTRSVSAGRVSMKSQNALRLGTNRHDLRTNVYRWRNGTWALASAKRNRWATDRQSMNVGGWRVPYLKRYPAF